MKAKCKSCGDIVDPKRGGEWLCCSCFKNEEHNRGFYMDKDRWIPDVYRFGGNPDDIERIDEGEE